MLYLVILLYAIFGFTFTLGKIVLFYSTPFFVVFIRMTIGGLLLGSYVAWYHRVSVLHARKDLWLYLQFIFFNICIFYGARSWALAPEQGLSTGKAALLMNLSPFFTALFAYFFLREKLTTYKIIGLIIGFAGMIPVALSKSTLAQASCGGVLSFSTPELVFVGAVACLSYSMIVMQQLVRHRGLSPLLVNAVCMLTGGIAMGGVSFGLHEQMIIGDPVLFWSVIILQIVASNILCANLQAFLLKHYSTTFMSFASFISPLFASLYGALLLNEVITWHFFASFFIVILGLSIFYFDDIRQGKFVVS